MKKIIMTIFTLVLLFGFFTIPTYGSNEEPTFATVSPLDTEVSITNNLHGLTVGETLHIEVHIANNTERDYKNIWLGLGAFEVTPDGLQRLTEILSVESDIYKTTETGTYFENFEKGQSSTVVFEYVIPESWIGKQIILFGSNSQTTNDTIITDDFSNYVFEEIIIMEEGYVAPFKVNVTWKNDFSSVHIGDTVQVEYEITNISDTVQENVWAGLGMFEINNEGQYIRISELLANKTDSYKTTENGAYIESLEAHESVTVVFEYQIPSSLADFKAALLGAVFQTTGNVAVFEDYITEIIVINEEVVILPIDNPFTDVKKEVYYYEPVMWAINNGITKGTSATEFSPQDPCTRKQVVTFLWRAFGCPEPASMDNPFADVAVGSYFEKPILWAYYSGITTGTDNTHFSPENPCTREQIAMFLWRANGKPTHSVTNNPFADVQDNSKFKDAILWAFENNITTGKTATTFEPKTTCTRCQIVTFLYRDKTE